MTREKLSHVFSSQLELNTVKSSSDTVVAVKSSSDTVVIDHGAPEENLMQKLFRDNGLPPVLPQLDLPYIISRTNTVDDTVEKIKKRAFKLCRALYIDAGHETFQQIIYGKERDPSYQAGYTIRIKEKSELKKIQNKLEAVCQFEGVEAMAQHLFIRGCLKSLALPERYKVEEFVYHLSKDPSKGGEDWGHQHAYDDPQILLNAIKKTRETLSKK